MTTESQTFWQSLETTALGDFMASSGWAFPTVETIHVIALVTVVGAIAIMDLRLVGLASKDTAISKVSQDTIRLTWIAFIVAAITGLLMFTSKASSYMINPYFLGKMAVMALAGINMAYFQFVTEKNMADWDNGAVVPAAVKMAGWLSLVFWAVIVFLGRAIGFTLGIYY